MKKKRYSGKRSPWPSVGKVFFSVVGVVVLLFVCMLLFAVVTDFRPEDRMRLEVSGASGLQTVRAGQEYSLMTFNIGYCGLDATQDFFMDGGTRARAGSAEDVSRNLTAVSHEMEEQNPDFLFLQEVDVNSVRSYGINQVEPLKALLPDRVASFALNFKVPFVPLPLTAPMGGVESGMLTLSAAAVLQSDRYAFDGEEPFPKRLFDLDRCFVVTRVSVEGKNELVLINAHFSAYDEGGLVREKQLAQISQFIQNEAALGHYVILGGDWNHQLPGTDYRAFGYDGPMPDWCMTLPEDFTPDGFHWAVDNSSPSCRGIDKPYDGPGNFAVVIDGFLLSDNIDITSVSTQDLAFAHSDHNPVVLRFSLQQPS